ncbi:metalloendopeptidase OMA1, mitochondrial [Trichonephila clavipes]|nr:metalloendopeptidase OMA1, mitochondrial [Trichonephila clavipes]
MSKFTNFSSSINPTLLTFRCLNFSRPPTYLLCNGFSSRSFPPSTISYLKVVNCRVNVQSLFRTSPPRHIPPVVWLVLRPVLKVAAVITGRSIRGWWRSLPKDKKTYLINELKANRRKIGIIMSLIFCLSLGYYISHLEYTPITDRRRFMAFNSKQITKILELEMDQLQSSESTKVSFCALGKRSKPQVQLLERLVVAARGRQLQGMTDNIILQVKRVSKRHCSATGRQVSRFTVARRLHKGGLFARRPERCLPLKVDHRHHRLQWGREHN